MARRKQSLAPEEDEPELDISSLIDVCFLLLIYFMVTSSIQPRESDLGIQLPANESNSSAPADIQPMLIEITQNGALTVNKDELMDRGAVGAKRELPLLQNRLEIYKGLAAAAGADALVKVSVNEEAPHQSVVDVLNCLIGMEVNQVTFTNFDTP